MKISQNQALLQSLSDANSNPADALLGNPASASTSSLQTAAPGTGSPATTNFFSSQQNWSLPADNGMGMQSFAETQTSNLNDMPAAATPPNLPNLPAAKFVASAADPQVVGPDAFAKACSEALYVSAQPGGASAVQAWLGTFSNAPLKSGVQSFLAQNAGTNPSSVIDAFGNYNNTLLQQAKAFFPTGSTAAAPSTPATATPPATSNNPDALPTNPSTAAAPSTPATPSTPSATFTSDAASQAAQAVAQIPSDGDTSTTSLNTFAQAAVWALNQSNTNPSNYQAFLAGIQNPQIKQNIDNFVQANAGQSAFNQDGTYNTDMYNVGTYADPSFGVDEGQADQKSAAATLAQPKGDVTPQAFASTAAYMLSEYNKPNHGNYQALLNLCSDPTLQTALQTAVQNNAGQDPQIDAQGNPQNSGLMDTLTAAYANAASNPSTWQSKTNSGAQQTYSQWAQTNTYPAVQSAAQKVLDDTKALSSAQQSLDTANQGLSQAETNLEAPDASGKQQPLSYWQDQQQQAAKSVQSAWETSRGDEAQFWSNLNSATGGAAQSAYDPYVKDPNYTTEGTMPQGFASAALPQPAATQDPGTASTPATTTTQDPGTVSTPATTTTATTTQDSGPANAQHGLTDTTTTTPAATSQTGTPSSAAAAFTWPPLNGAPANAVATLTNPTAMGSMSKDDYEHMTLAFAQLYNQNPATYFATLAQVKDPALAGALNFAVNDTALYNAKNLQNNGASQATELAQYGNYYNSAKAGGFRNWSPSAQTPAGATTAPGSTDPSKIFPGTDANSKAAVTAMNAASPAGSNGVNSATFGAAAVQFASLYKSNPPLYYQALSQVKDSKLRDGLNYAVLDTLSNHASNAGNASYYQGLYGKVDHVGFVNTKNSLTTNSDHTTLSGGGPLSGKPVLS